MSEDFYKAWLERVSALYLNNFPEAASLPMKSYHWRADYDMGYDPDQSFWRYIEKHPSYKRKIK